MPEYIYRAVDSKGVLVKSRITEKSKHNLVKRLKANGLTPIDVIQTSFGKYQRSNKSGIASIEELMKVANQTDSAKKDTRRKRK